METNSDRAFYSPSRGGVELQMATETRSWSDMPLDWRDFMWRHFYRQIALCVCPECYTHLSLSTITATGQVWAVCSCCEDQTLFDTIPLPPKLATPNRR